MSSISDAFEKIADWLLYIPTRIPILLGADPHNAGLIRALSTLIFIALILFLFIKIPFGSLLSYFRKTKPETDKRS